jgi:hypothetical protein
MSRRCTPSRRRCRQRSTSCPISIGCNSEQKSSYHPTTRRVVYVRHVHRRALRRVRAVIELATRIARRYVDLREVASYNVQ